MKSFFVKFNKLASSSRLAVCLIGALLCIALVGSFIPQTSELFQNAHHSGGYAPIVLKTISLLKLNSVFSSWPFFIAIALLFINISFCMGKRVKAVFEDSAAAGRFFTRAGLPLTGSMLFHLGLLIVLTGALYDHSTRMKGALFITQGQEIEEKHGSYVSVEEAPFFLENHSNIKMALKDVSFEYIKGVMVEMKAGLGITDGAFSKDYTLRVNEPLKHGDIMVIMQKFGFAPLVTLTGKDGKTLVNTYLSLAPAGDGAVEDEFELPGTDLILAIKLYPDPEVKDGKIRSRTMELRAPQIRIQMDKRIKPGGRIKQALYRGFMKPGETRQFKGYRLSAGDIRYWIQFDVEKEPGKKIVYAGYWIGLAGITLRLLLIFLRPIEDGGDAAGNEVAAEAEKEKAV